MGDANFYVKKVVSFNPEKYAYLEINEALRKYAEYLKLAIEKGAFIKNFETWIITEI